MIMKALVDHRQLVVLVAYTMVHQHITACMHDALYSAAWQSYMYSSSSPSKAKDKPSKSKCLQADNSRFSFLHRTHSAGLLCRHKGLLGSQAWDNWSARYPYWRQTSWTCPCSPHTLLGKEPAARQGQCCSSARWCAPSPLPHSAHRQERVLLCTQGKPRETPADCTVTQRKSARPWTISRSEACLAWLVSLSCLPCPFLCICLGV